MRPASEVAREWLPAYSVSKLTAAIEADRAEVRAAALEEAARSVGDMVAEAGAMPPEDVDQLMHAIRALATRSTEEPTK